MAFTVDKIRNIAIIAHVDHGKTTLVDELLKQSGTFKSHQTVSDRVMDSMDLERERGITIAAKNTAILYKDYKINIVDTPGHSDFGGEVERILSMVDGCCLLVDAAEGPLPQTRYVLSKALEQNLKLIVVINKVDRKDARADEVLNEIFDLFIELGANEEQCDFPYIYAIAREGKSGTDLAQVPNAENLDSLFEMIIDKVPHPKLDENQPPRILIANLGYSEYLGRLAIGKVKSGSIVRGKMAAVVGIDENGAPKSKQFKVQALYTYHGLKQVEAEEVAGGDVAVLAGIEEIAIGDSIVGMPDVRDSTYNPAAYALPRIKIDEPTLEIEWIVNNSPLAGREGEHVTSRKIRDRLLKEAMTNVALRFQEADSADRFILRARGELQVSILAETLRREGYEFALSQPQILFKEIDGKIHEPIEHAVLDIPVFAQGAVTQMLQKRKGMLQAVAQRGDDRMRLEFSIPSRGLIGLRNQFMTQTNGQGLFNFSSAGYEEHKGDIQRRLTGALVSDRAGDSNSYALVDLQERGILFIGHATQVYEGMIIGENAKENDLNVNPCKAKQLTNFRTVNKDDAIVLTPPKSMTIERGLEWINEDELIEITPKNIRGRKRILAKNMR
ncbi:MAG: translational GTPase TypA [Bdellovibrionota bacterium]